MTKLVRIIALIAFVLNVGCQGVKGEGSYKPPGLPLKVSVDTNGEIKFEIEYQVQYPTPLGTFAVGVVVDPTTYFEIESILTVRLNSEDRFYNLHGQDFIIDFEAGYYEKVNLTKSGNNLLLELRRSDLQPSVVTNPPEAIVPTQIDAVPEVDLGEWMIIVGAGFSSYEGAWDWLEQYKQFSYPVQVFYRNTYIRTAVVGFSSQSDAEYTLPSVQTLNKNAYLRSVSEWCPVWTPYPDHIECR